MAGMEQPNIDWEQHLAEQGMPAELPEDGIASGDALEISSPTEAAERAEFAQLEMTSEAQAGFDSNQETELE